MNRRDLLAWISRGLAVGVTAVVGLPAVQYLLGRASSGSSGETRFARLIRVKDLVPGRPTLVPVMGQQQDAWIRRDQQIVGRVWLVRPASDPPDSESADCAVRAVSSVCPHMGCQVQSQAGGKGFQCPCHRATFGLDGRRQSDPRTGDRNHAPRDLDDLDCRVVQDRSTGDWWVEVKYQKFETGREQRVVGA